MSECHTVSPDKTVQLSLSYQYIIKLSLNNMTYIVSCNQSFTIYNMLLKRTSTGYLIFCLVTYF